MAVYQELIAAQTVSESNLVQFDFNSIPQTYTDLYLVASLRAATAETFTGIWGRFNNAAVANSYSTVRMRMDNTTRLTDRSSGSNGDFAYFNFTAPSANATANTFGVLTMYIPNYSNTTTNKSVITEGYGGTNGIDTRITFSTTTILSNAAISSFFISSGWLAVPGSTVSLYGIKRS
jgi:hypothetical protein